MTATRPSDLDSRNTPLTVYLVTFAPAVAGPPVQVTFAVDVIIRTAAAIKKHLPFVWKSRIITG
jgi:hypothetical protein